MNETDTTKSFFTKFGQQTYADKHVILSPGDEPEGIYYILEGKVKQYDIAQNGDELVVNILMPGSHFLMSWIFGDKANAWYFEAIGETTVHIAPQNKTMDFFKQNPDATLDFLKRLCSGAAGQQRRMAHLMGGSAESRVLFELIVEFKRFGKPVNSHSEISISEAELAAKAGLSRESVNRELAKLKAEKVITRRYKKIGISDLALLENKLGHTV